MKIVWLDSAVNDLVRLRKFISDHNEKAARRAADLIKNAVLRLENTPYIGKPLEDLPEYYDMSIRFGSGGYVLRYRIYDTILYIVHIRHYRESEFK